MPLPLRREDDLLAVVDPGAFGERGDGRLRHLRVVGEAELLEPLGDREAGVDQPAALAPLGAFWCSRPRAARPGRRPVFAAREWPPAASCRKRRRDGRQLELGGVGLDQRLERLPSSAGAHRPASLVAQSVVVREVGLGARGRGEPWFEVVERGRLGVRRAGPSTATARPSCAPAASAPRTASSTWSGPSIPAEHQHVDHRPGGLASDRSRSSIASHSRRSRRASAPPALLGERQRAVRAPPACGASSSR